MISIAVTAEADFEVGVKCGKGSTASDQLMAGIFHGLGAAWRRHTGSLIRKLGKRMDMASFTAGAERTQRGDHAIGNKTG